MWEEAWEFTALEGQPLSSTSTCSPADKLSKLCCTLGTFIQASLHINDWSLSPLSASLLLREWGGAENSKLIMAFLLFWWSKDHSGAHKESSTLNKRHLSHMDFGRIQLILSMLKEILKSEHVFTIAHCLPSVLPYSNFSQVSLFPLDPWTLLTPKSEKSITKVKHGLLISFLWNQLMAERPFSYQTLLVIFNFSNRVSLISACPCFTLYKKNLFSEFEKLPDFWDWSSYAVFLIKVSLSPNLF